MKIDLLIAEIGSTTTVVNAFNGIDTDDVSFIGQGYAPTTVTSNTEGDVTVGLYSAVSDLERRVGERIEYREMFAASSAAGGLKMSVHGLVYDMTVRAANAAALGAGAIVKLATAGKLFDYDIDEIRSIAPNVILIAGGTDHGERETAIHNAKLIAAADMGIPVIYAGNIQNQSIVSKIFAEKDIPCYITENVYPKLDLLNIEPARKVIHSVFEQHIIKAPGMEHIKSAVTGVIIPTPGAVMEAARLLYDEIGDLMVVDIGGATTDVHTVTPGSEEIAVMQTSPEPFAKRTVEGDLGLYVNAKNVIALIGQENLARELSLNIDDCMKVYKPIPTTDEQLLLTQRLCETAGITAICRHSGAFRHIYSPSGRQTIAEGKDLTKVKYIIGTGGALTRLPDCKNLLRKIADCNQNGKLLMPRPGETALLFDNDYIMAAAGVMSKKYPKAALQLMKRSLGLK